MDPDKINKDSNYFSFSELSHKIEDINVSNFSGWSVLELFKFDNQST